jgi:hypothetical protein
MFLTTSIPMLFFSKFTDIADCLNLLAEFVIAEAKYARIKNQQIV